MKLNQVFGGLFSLIICANILHTVDSKTLPRSSSRGHRVKRQEVLADYGDQTDYSNYQDSFSNQTLDYQEDYNTNTTDPDEEEEVSDDYYEISDQLEETIEDYNTNTTEPDEKEVSDDYYEIADQLEETIGEHAEEASVEDGGVLLSSSVNGTDYEELASGDEGQISDIAQEEEASGSGEVLEENSGGFSGEEESGSGESVDDDISGGDETTEKEMASGTGNEVEFENDAMASGSGEVIIISGDGGELSLGIDEGSGGSGEVDYEETNSKNSGDALLEADDAMEYVESGAQASESDVEVEEMPETDQVVQESHDPEELEYPEAANSTEMLETSEEDDDSTSEIDDQDEDQKGLIPEEEGQDDITEEVETQGDNATLIEDYENRDEESVIAELESILEEQEEVSNDTSGGEIETVAPLSNEIGEEVVVKQVVYELGTDNEAIIEEPMVAVNITEDYYAIAIDNDNSSVDYEDTLEDPMVAINVTEDYYAITNDNYTSSVDYENQIEEEILVDERPCSNSTFGCCGQSEVPAHGDNQEGCCLESEFGCCPDYIRSAHSKNGDGCDCTNSAFGCCPDDVTTPRGKNLEGCGCQYSEFGCCPDQYTQAFGPEYEGCPCHTHEHGCCPDGETVALGPNLEGCQGCEISEHGCCPDNFTPAEGPYSLGCECAGSEFGCCPDGVSEALDPNAVNEAGNDTEVESAYVVKDFHGCGETPGEACHLDKDPGVCKENFTVRWFFDREYGGCSRFWWSDCGGNSNRFIDQSTCEEHCVKPSGYGRCYMPKVRGPCKGSYSMWYFDQQWQKCLLFTYGGCMGNGNRFETQVECQETCLRSETEDLDVCSQPLEPGPCRGMYQRFYYDQEEGVCKAFNYTGCLGNKNRFSRIEDCENSCKHKAIIATAKRVCTLPKMQGVCQDQEAAWYFDKTSKRCQPFYYTGCGGNENRFRSLEECETVCPNAFPPEINVDAKILVVEEKEKAVFKVSVEANPPPTIIWQYKDQNIDMSGRFEKLPDGSLKIQPSEMEDSGVYTIIADNGLGQVARNQITLKVHPSKMPIEVTVSNAKTEFEFGQEMAISCSVRGYPIPVIRWYKNNTPLPKSERISVTDENKMVISRATPIDGGVYTCRATNKHESVSDTVEVRVKKGEIPKECVDKPEYANCELIVKGEFCNKNAYFADFCCKSCSLAGQIAPET